MNIKTFGLVNYYRVTKYYRLPYSCKLISKYRHINLCGLVIFYRAIEKYQTVTVYRVLNI